MIVELTALRRGWDPAANGAFQGLALSSSPLRYNDIDRFRGNAICNYDQLCRASSRRRRGDEIGGSPGPPLNAHSAVAEGAAVTIAATGINEMRDWVICRH